jgi:hypothetical protein
MGVNLIGPFAESGFFPLGPGLPTDFFALAATFSRALGFVFNTFFDFAFVAMFTPWLLRKIFQLGRTTPNIIEKFHKYVMDLRLNFVISFIKDQCAQFFS